jgi:uncharacterized protein YprB with RNaseH-like and TPR domain
VKVAFLDIETTRLVATKGLGFILCCSMKLSGQKEVHTVRIDDSPGYKKCLYNDTECVSGIADWANDVDPDVIVTFNGDYYDIPYINTRRLGAGRKALPPVRYLDHWKTCRYNLRLHSNSLDALATHLGVPHKKTRFDPDVWQKAAYGNREAMDLIVHHCELDVVVLEECHDRVLPVLRKLKGIL